VIISPTSIQAEADCFNQTITPMNSLGIALTLLGGGIYARVELMEKHKRSAPPPPQTAAIDSAVADEKRGFA
jgi:hypothetical protein